MSFGVINSVGNQELVAAESGKSVVLESIFIVAAGAGTVTFQSVVPGSAPTNISGTMSLGANGQLAQDSVQMGLMQTDIGGGLRLVSGVGVQGFFRYSKR